MGEKKVNRVKTARQSQFFINHFINDLKVLERMIEEGFIESDKQRCGVEQELCFIDASGRPAPRVMEILNRSSDPHFTTELAKFNAEINLDPSAFEGSCLSKMEQELNALLGSLDELAAFEQASILLTGILPSITKKDLSESNMTPLKRYQVLNQALRDLRGGPYRLRLEGTDQLITSLDSAMFESCNTSFQVHLQLSVSEFVPSYNWSQVIAAPVLAAATNSPMLLEKRLWRETRIGLFQQSLDTRSTKNFNAGKAPRVGFGNRWLQHSVTELFQEDISRHRVLIHTPDIEDAATLFDEKKIPKLVALQMHNGTVYRWNRPCYGITEGKAHLRIENRYLPSGPSVVDEVANAAFWLGLMKGLPDRYRNISKLMSFDDAKANFISAARGGLATQINWPGSGLRSAPELILNELLPIASEGLRKAQVAKEDITKYLGIIASRVKSQSTGAQWQIDTFNELTPAFGPTQATMAMVRIMRTNQTKGLPVHEWPIPKVDEARSLKLHFDKISQIMSSDLFTVQPDDPIDLAINMLKWHHIHHLPVEDGQGKLLGLITASEILTNIASSNNQEKNMLLVKDYMIQDPMVVDMDTSVSTALDLIVNHKIGCLPVLDNKRLIGVVTTSDLAKLAKELIHDT